MSDAAAAEYRRLHRAGVRRPRDKSWAMYTVDVVNDPTLEPDTLTRSEWDQTTATSAPPPDPRERDVSVPRRFVPRPIWRQFALCQYVDDPSIFFPTRGEDLSAAKAICAECPAQAACYEAGISEKFGRLGGGPPNVNAAVNVDAGTCLNQPT